MTCGVAGGDGPRTLYEKVWQAHEVVPESAHPATLYVDLHLVHERTSFQAFGALRNRGLPVRRPSLTVAVTDHSVPSRRESRFGPVGGMDPAIGALLDNAAEFGLEVLGPNDAGQGIVHVIGPEQGLTQPGMLVVCADSHTSTHGAFGALAFGIGTTEVGHVLATQSTLQRRQPVMLVRVDGELSPDVSSKDLALWILSRHGVAFGRGHVIEFAGAAIGAMSMESRMTLCNMSIEMGARASMIAPDTTTAEYLRGRRFSPRGADWDEAVRRWASLRSDPGAVFDAELRIDAGEVVPMVTYGTTPAMAIPVDGVVPHPDRVEGQDPAAVRAALEYTGLTPGVPIGECHVDRVFIGSCTNSRIEDLRAAAAVLAYSRVADGTSLLVVPGSQAVKRQAEAEGIDAVFERAGARWGEPGCSLCVGHGGDVGRPGEVIASTSNRNFQGRQGPGARTLLMSPATAAATAVAGHVAAASMVQPGVAVRRGGRSEA